jgi:soluble lytic murein transglycosylase-like protein
MSFKPIRISLVVAALCGALPAVAYAQIYSWRDGAGNLVLSDHPKDAAARTFPVAAGAALRTTRPEAGRRTSSYDALIAQHASNHGIRAELVQAVIQAESAFNPMARSIKGAMGLMQLMPATALRYGVINAYDPAENIRAGVSYLKSLLQRYSQNEELALAAYNAGPGAVEKYGAVPPYRETRDYVSKIRSRAGASPMPTRIYRLVDFKDGREVVRYTNVLPTPDAVTASRR